MPTAAWAASDDSKTTLPPWPRIGSSCCHQEIGGAHIDGEQRVELVDRQILDRRGLRDAGIGDQYVEAVADDATNLRRQLVRPVGRREIGAQRLRAAAGGADLLDDGFGLRGGLAVMHEHLGAGLGEAPARWRGRCRAKRR